jgi:predicted dehydrogenase
MGAHLANMCLSIPNAKIVGVYDSAEAQAQTVASQLKCDRYTQIDDMLNRPDLDAVIVATPNYTHRQYSVVALKAGKHVFCEKPMALEVEDCDAMIHEAKRAGLTLMIGHVMRFYTGSASVKRAISDDEIGRPIVSSVSRTDWVEVGAWSSSWRRSRELCNNSLFESTIHEIDLMRWLVGDVESVQGYGFNFVHPELDYDDCTVAILRFRNGALGTLESGYAFRSGDHRVKVNGTAGVAQIDFGTYTISIVGEDKQKRTEPLNGDAEPYAAELQHFVKCLSEGTEPLTDGLEGRGAIEIAVAINRSAESGKPVGLPLL